MSGLPEADEDLVTIEIEAAEQAVGWAELDRMRREDLMCDMQFTGAEGTPIPAHCCVVAASSTYLRSTLANKAVRESKFVIELPSISTHVIDSILTFIYTGKLCVKASELTNVEATASVLSIESLVRTCEKFNTDNGIQLESENPAMEFQEIDGNDMQETGITAEVYPADMLKEESAIESSSVIELEETPQITLVKEEEHEILQPSEEIVLEPIETLPNTHLATEVTTEEVGDELSNPMPSITMDTTFDSTSISHISEEMATTAVEHNESAEIEEETMVIDAVTCGDMVEDTVTTDNIVERTVAASNPGVVMYDMSDLTPIQDGVVTVEAGDGGDRQVAIQVQVESAGGEESDSQGLTTTAYVTIPSNLQLKTEGGVSQIILQKLFNQQSTDVVEQSESLQLQDEEEIRTLKTEDSNSDLYSCEFCGMTFEDLSLLKTHLFKVKHDMKDAFVCKMCGNKFKYKHNLKHHMSRHLSVKPYLCVVDGCGKSFSTKADLQTHNRSHTGDKPYSCEFCKKGFSQSSNLLTHKRSVHNDEFLGGARNHGCEECGKKFKTKDMLNKHLKRHAQVLTCTQCGDTFRIRKDLLKHSREVHGISDFIPAKEDGATVELYQCTSCDKTFLDMSKLTQHLSIVHKKAKRYSCTMKDCSYTAYFKYAVERHYIKVHVEGVHKPFKASKEKKFICHECGATFLGFRGLGVHMRKQHDHTGPFTYDQALHYAVEIPAEETVKSEQAQEMVALTQEKETTDDKDIKLAMRSHRKSHDKSLEFKCEHCGDLLSSDSALRKHLSLHNINEKRDIFTCVHCNKTFFQKAHLKRHTIQFHSKQTRFRCNQHRCSYECYYASQMKEHFKFKHKSCLLPDMISMQCSNNSGKNDVNNSIVLEIDGNDEIGEETVYEDGNNDARDESCHEIEELVVEEIKNVKKLVKEMATKCDTITIVTEGS